MAVEARKGLKEAELAAVSKMRIPPPTRFRLHNDV
jgi:hypothetical protein